MLKIFAVFALSICLATTGCTTTRSVPLAQPAEMATPQVAVGDRVVVTMRSGIIRHLRVESIDATTLTGRVMEGAQRGTSSQVVLADVAQLQVRQVRWGRTVAWIYGIVVVATVAGLASCFSGGRVWCSKETE